MKHEPGMAYRTKTLNKVFAVLSILFLGVVIWMLMDDYIRPWKAYQIKALEIERVKISKEIDSFDKKLDKDKVAQLEKDIKEADGLVAGKKEAIEKAEEELDQIKGKIQAEKITNGEYNALVSETVFNYELAASHGDKKAPKMKKDLDRYKANFAASNERVKALTKSQKAVIKQIDDLESEKTDANKRFSNLMGAKERMEAALVKTDEKNPIWLIRNLPMTDFLDPTLKIHQIVLKNITDDRYFKQVPKVDRCTTCHTFIDKVGYEDQENPYKTHPNLDMMVGAKSHHPKNDFGCTTCHGGEGHRVTDFQSIAHTPQNKEQAKQWKEKYNWHPPHKVMDPMKPLQNTEGACIKCHQEQQRIPGASVVNNGYELIENYGCYACHNIKGWQDKVKPGPSLRKVSSKISKSFFKAWVWDPKEFNPHSKMPSFFNQSNNSKKEFMNKNIAEVNAMAEYVWEIAKPYKPFKKYTGGDEEKGKELIGSVGCIGCHQIEGIESSMKVGNRRGPHLTGIGSKVSGDWLVSWLKKPSHYQSDTIMPSFRLTDTEANNMTAYLLSLKNKKFVNLKFSELDKELRDELLVEYFSAFDTTEGARGTLAEMTDRERTLELGKRSIGKYGCYSCHDLKGFDGRPPIGPDLSKIGSKPIAQFGFGHEKIDHTRYSWITHHLENPKRWDKGGTKPFKDLLRMPNFYLKKDEIQAMTATLLGFVADYIPEAGKKQLDKNEALAEDGAKVIAKYNCMGCHKIDGMGGKILAMYEDDINEGPPRLNGQGHRVQADWLHHFFNNVYPIRPWLKVRMPSFKLTNKERNLLVGYFRNKAKEVAFEESKAITWEPGEREGAKKLWESYACASCHTQGFNKEEASAPNLHYAKKRLRGSWMETWLDNPQAILEGTLMPSFWEDGEAQDPSVFGGDVKKQIRALRKYIQEFGYDKYHAPAPGKL